MAVKCCFNCQLLEAFSKVEVEADVDLFERESIQDVTEVESKESHKCVDECAVCADADSALFKFHVEGDATACCR